MHIPDFIPRYPFILSILTFKMSQLKCCCETERALFWISGKGKYLREIQIYELSPPISTSLINTHKTKKLKSKTINLCLAYLICCSSFYAPVKKVLQMWPDCAPSFSCNVSDSKLGKSKRYLHATTYFSLKRDCSLQ